MEYITSGDRIAVENFEIGSLYKVTFLNETEVYFMCCGIGKDFVMLMSNEPRLFSLTMLSAAEVDAIDEYTPLPPPTPPTNLLQYQTGEPPFTFTTSDTELFSWYIKGPGGEKTANLLNIEQFALSYPQYCSYQDDTLDLSTNGALYNTGIAVDIPAGSVFQCTPVSKTNATTNARFFFVYDDDTTAESYITTAQGEPRQPSATKTTLTKHVKSMRVNWSTANSGFKVTDCMINTGSTPIPFEPYGYKIPILCNTTTSNIYIEEALGENDILHSTETDYTITTEIGENILRIQGETQPSRMQIVYKWEFEG